MKTSRSVLLREIIHVACGCRVEHANTFRVYNEACFGATSGGKYNDLESVNNNIFIENVFMKARHEVSVAVTMKNTVF
jgi:hypothetical protein